MEANKIRISRISEPKFIKQEPYVGEDGIYVPLEDYVYEGTGSYYKMILSKEIFVEAYNKWIKDDDNEVVD